MDTLKIYIADDHQILIDGLSSFFKEQGMEVIGHANDGQSVIRDLYNKRPDVILLDLNMPKLDGLSALEKIKLNFPGIKVIILSNYHQTQLIKQAREKGANGYLVKNGSKDELLKALEHVQHQDSFFESAQPATAADTFAENTLFADEFTKKHNLTRREVDIIRMICSGLSTKEISDKLFIAEFTVSTHRRNILGKLQLKNAAALINFARENGIA